MEYKNDLCKPEMKKLTRNYIIDSEINTTIRNNGCDCSCKGTGWILSKNNTWHECPIHKKELLYFKKLECFTTQDTTNQG